MATLCQALEIPYVMPEKNNKTTLQTGAYYSPEEICLPFKLILGNLIEAVEGRRYDPDGRKLRPLPVRGILRASDENPAENGV
jgi:predicted nucleotide-binding protein (sugar kinase/HSP70/actin superfamily)